MITKKKPTGVKLRVTTMLLVTLAAQPLAGAVELVGYIPYYRLNNNYLNNVLPGQLALLDEVRYFGLSVDGFGGIASNSGSVQSQKNNIAAIQSIINTLPAEDRPRLNITLGGASVDSVFSSIASNPARRDTLAANVSSLLSETGAASVDINWEFPDAGIERTTYYPAMLKRLKEEVGPSKKVYATVAPSVVISNSVFSGANAIDGVSIMTYDLGWWGNAPSNPNDGEHSLNEYVVDTINAWTDPVSANSQRPWVWTNATWGNDTPADKIGIGLPFYARNIFGNQAHTFADLTSVGNSLGDGYYTISGQTVWIPDQADIEDRVQLAHDEGLDQVFIWEIGQDLNPSDPNSMLSIAAAKLASLAPEPGDFNGDGFIDGADLQQWRGDVGVNGDSDADADADSDLADLFTWQRGYSPALNAVAAVPEPNSMLLVGLSVFGIGLGSRARRRQP